MSSFHATDLEFSTIYQIGRLSRAALENTERAVAETGIPLRMHWVLLDIGPDGSRSQSEIGDELRIDRSDMVRLVDVLEKRGLVKRRKDPQDRRRHLIELTKAGAKMRATSASLVGAAESRTLAALSDKQRARLHDLTSKALRGLDAASTKDAG